MQNKSKKLLFVFLIFLVLPSFVSAALTDNLTSYWKFDENTGTTTADSVGTATGRINGAAWTTDGLIGNALNFTDDNVITDKYAVSITRPLTINLWVKGTHSASFPTILMENSSANNGLLYMRTASETSFFTGNEFSVAKVINTSNYTMLTIVVLNTGATSFYWNGVSTTKASGTGVTTPNFSSIKFGQGFTAGFTGLIDEVGIWSRNLSAAEVQSIYTTQLAGGSIVNGTTPSTFVFWNFVNQSPSDLSTTSFGSLNITYNTSQTMNTSSVYLNYTITNSTTSVNGTAQATYQRTNATNTSTIWNTILGDNNYFPAVYNYDEEIQERTIRSGTITLSINNDLALISLINVRNDTLYNIFEVMMNTTSAGSALVYYCNSSYTTGALSTSPNCALISTFNGTGFNHTHEPAYNYSKHNVFSFPVVNGKFGNVSVTNTSYFVIKRTAGVVYVHYSNLSSPRVNAFQTSGTNGATWNNLASTFLVDSHLHQYTGFNYFQYQMCGQNTTGSVNCSDVRADLIDLTALQPTSPQVYSPANADYQYNNSFLLNFTRSQPYSTATNISYYTLSLLNNDSTLNTTNPFLLNKLVYTNTAENSTTSATYVNVKTSVLNAFISNLTTEMKVSGGTGFIQIVFNYADGTSNTTAEQSTASANYVTKTFINPYPYKETTSILTQHKIAGGFGAFTQNNYFYGGNLTAFQADWNTSAITKSGNYILRMGVTDLNGLTNYAQSSPFNITSNINITLIDNFTGNYVSDFTGWLYNNATGWNQTFSSNTATYLILTIYSGFNMLYVEQSNYSLTAANYFNFTLSDTLQTYNKTFQLYSSNSVHIKLYDQLTDLLINNNISTVSIASGTYNNQSNTTNGEVFFDNLPIDNYTIVVTSPNYVTANYQISVYNRSSQFIKARLLPAVFNVSIGVYVKNQLFQSVENAVVTIQRQFSGGSWATTTQITTDVNGFNYVSLQEAILYRFIITAPNYVTKQYDMYVYAAIQPYTFILTTTGATLYTNYWNGVNFYYSPTQSILNQTTYNFSITTYNSTLDIQWTSVTANGTTINVTGSSSGGTATLPLNLATYSGALNVTYQFYFYNTNTSTYHLYRIPVTYYIGSHNTTQTSQPRVWGNLKNEIQSGSSTGSLWATILAMFIILAIIITLIQLSGSQVVGLIGGIVGLIFFGYVGMLNPIFAYLTGTIIVIFLFMNRG